MRSAWAPSGLRSSFEALINPYDGGKWCFLKTCTVSRASCDCDTPAGSVPLSGRSSKVRAISSFGSAARVSETNRQQRQQACEQAAERPRGFHYCCD